MPSKDVSIILTAKDNTSSTLKAIGREAERTGKQLEQAGKQGARGMNEAKVAGRDLAIGIGALGGAFVLASRSATGQRREIESLRRAYGDNAGQILDWTQAIEDSSNVSDEAARKAALLASTLSQEYGLSLEQVQVLLQRTADVAEDRGLAFEDAAQRVTSAIRGEAESAEVLGLVLNDSALGLDRMSASTTNAEKAQIRFTAFMDQSAESAGVAAAAADTTRGRVIDLAQSATDAGQAFADWTGPVGEAAGELGNFGLEVGLAAGGLVKLGSGLKTLSGAAGLAGLAGTLGPIGLAGAAIAAGAAFLILRDDTDEFAEGAKIAEQGAQDLETALKRLSAAGSPHALELSALSQQIGLIGKEMTALIPAAADAERELRILLEEPQIIQSDAELMTAIGRVTLYREQIGQAEEASRKLGEAETALGVIFNHNGPSLQYAVETTRALFDLYDQGLLTPIELADAILLTADSLDVYDRRAISAGESTTALGQSAEGATKSIGVLFTGTKHLSDRLKDYTEGAERATAATRELAAVEPPPLVSGAKDVTATVIPAPIIATPDPMAISFFTDLEIAYANVGRGALMASEALGVFKGAQDGLLGSQDVYNQQLGEYNSQISAIDAALALIQEKQAAGIALSEQEQGILDGSTAALERLTGGTNDATLARAELAIQYAENMKVGDQLNENMQGQQEITGALIGIVRDLILALDGVPEDVKTDVRAIDNASGTISSVRGQMDALDGKVSTTYIDTVRRNIGFTDQLYTGGTIGTIHAGSRGAAGGITVGEFGREFIPNPPHGMQVMPHGASMSRLESDGKRGRRAAGVTNIFRGPVTLSVDSPDNEAAWRQQAIRGVRP